MLLCIALMITGSHLCFYAPSITVKVIGAIKILTGATAFELIRIKEKKKLNATFGIVEYLNGFRIKTATAIQNGRKFKTAYFIKDEPEEKDSEADDLP